jgi:hypothetical protein
MATPPALQIHARLLSDPPLWAIEVRDGATAEILWSSWTDDWSAYATLDEARRRADEVVARLLPSDLTRAIQSARSAA